MQGQTFHNLTVIDCAGKLDGRRYSWICKCKCGKIVTIEGSRLRSGNTKSCGCQKNIGLIKYNQKKSKESEIPLGTCFGKLKVIENIGYREQVKGHRRIWYKCICECGNIKEVMGNQLKNHQIMSCGKCNFNSKGEYEIKQLLDTWNINYKHDINFSELTEQTGRKLRFDFIIYDKNFEKPIRFIEFDGRQHILGPEAIWSNSDPLEKIQERDKIKNDFCLKNNYQLIRIPYTKLGNITIFDLLEDTFLVSKGE